MKIHESAEMYLETILILTEEKQRVRMIDIAEKMSFSKPSVSIFLKNLRQNGYILTDEKGYVSLTESGRQIAEKTYERHRLLTSFLTSIGVDDATASSDACKMEHDISDTTFDCIKAFYEKTN